MRQLPGMETRHLRARGTRTVSELMILSLPWHDQRKLVELGTALTLKGKRQSQKVIKELKRR